MKRKRKRKNKIKFSVNDLDIVVATTIVGILISESSGIWNTTEMDIS